MATGQHIHCPACGYDLHGLLEHDQVTCPECGQRYTTRTLHKPTAKWSFRVGTALLCFWPSLMCGMALTFSRVDVPGRYLDDHPIIAVIGLALLYPPAYAFISGPKAWWPGSWQRHFGALLLTLLLVPLNVIASIALQMLLAMLEFCEFPRFHM